MKTWTVMSKTLVPVRTQGTELCKKKERLRNLPRGRGLTACILSRARQRKNVARWDTRSHIADNPELVTTTYLYKGATSDHEGALWLIEETCGSYHVVDFHHLQHSYFSDTVWVCENLGIIPFMKIRHDYNVKMVQKLYATLEWARRMK
jgi:hypothetical protein